MAFRLLEQEGKEPCYSGLVLETRACPVFTFTSRTSLLGPAGLDRDKFREAATKIYNDVKRSIPRLIRRIELSIMNPSKL